MEETIKKPKGTLIKVLPIKREIEKNQYYDSLLIWYRDENGVKKTRFIDRCKIPFYIIKDKESKEDDIKESVQHIVQCSGFIRDRYTFFHHIFLECRIVRIRDRESLSFTFYF